MYNRKPQEGLVRIRFCQVATVLLFLASPALGQAQFEKAVQVMGEYFEMLATYNIETAELMWTDQAQERSRRFGIEFTGAPLKIDCVSPVGRNPDLMLGNLARTARKHEDLEDGYVRLLYSSIVNSDLVEHNYYMVKSGDWYFLTYAQDYFARNWDIVESRYFRVHVDPDRKPYVYAGRLQAADHLFEKLVGDIQIGDSTVEMIAAKKIEFFYCNSDEQVKEITGHSTRGTADLASSDIISASFPHLHELAHLLVNIKLRKPPLYTLPIVREGTAVAFGGRWGKDVEALLDLALFLHREKLVELDSILTRKGFHETVGADISYPVVGLWVTFLIDHLGLERFFDLYLELSGSIDEINKLESDQIKAVFTDFSGTTDWPALVNKFEAYMLDRLDRRAAVPGRPAADAPVVSGDGYSLFQDDDWLGFVFVTDSSGAQGSLFFGREDGLEGVRSELYEEQFGTEREFEGFRYAIRYDKNEAGLYDYVTSRLLAKYIHDISPSEEYYDPEARSLAIRFRRHLVGNLDFAKEEFVHLPE
ncbi:MAG: hypothetical protein JSU65_10120 [Candidatus Zixiibacteriota bacterium]|nr:MAG: hypothetical protein JSU65_10120 [candidate division Zixibacteria bacterium]